jgi:hypothetical protein
VPTIAPCGSQERGQREPVGLAHRHVLHRMHGEVGAALEQGLLELLDEQPLAARGGERRAGHLIAAGGHRHERHREAGMYGAEARADVLGLPEGEGRFARGDAKGHGSACHSERGEESRRRDPSLRSG